jgi:signal transduction histidine kinase
VVVSLQWRIAMIIAITIALAVVGLVFLTRGLLLNASMRQDVAQAEQTMVRVQQGLQAEVGNLASLAYDWSVWDDAYDFIANRTPAFATTNLDLPGYFEQMGLRAIAWLDPAGGFLHGTHYTADTAVIGPLSASLVAIVRQERCWRWPAAAAEKSDPAHASSGLGGHGEGIVLLAARPVYRSDGSGPSNGNVVFVRDLSAAMLARLGKLASSPVTLQPDTAAGGPDLAVAIGDENTLIGSLRLRDAEGRPLGRLRAVLSRPVFAEGLATLRVVMLVLVGGGAVLLLAVLILLRVQVVDPVRALAVAADRLAVGERPPRIDVRRKDEIGHLSRRFDAMAAAIIEHQRELERRVAERTADLRRAQEDLVRSERLAALGQMVAAVAHELNTPLGIAITSASHLHDRFQTFLAGIPAEQLGPGGPALMATLQDGLHLLQRNLERSAGLVTSFKQAAADQAVEEPRDFDLRSYTEVLLDHLRPVLDAGGHRVTVVGPPALAVRGNPGAYAQIITNLLTNVVQHAFADRRDGRVTITLAVVDGQVVVTVIDDGIGISSAVLPRIFEPFFTTRRGQGGTGLGLHLCYNLARQQLGGSLTCASTLGTGTTFTLRFPPRPPAADGVASD